MKKKVLYYISSHGYGHAARAGQVIRELTPDYEIHIKSMAPHWLLESVIGLLPPIYPDSYDIGCVQLNNMDVDVARTVTAYKAKSIDNISSMDREIRFVKKGGFELLISDIPPFPFCVAKEASIPSLFIGNFTWKGIYSAYLKEKNDSVLCELAAQYSMATSALITPLAMDMAEFSCSRKIGLIARQGANVREKLNTAFGIPKKNRLVFLYPGNLGLENVDPMALEQLAEFSFISFYPLKREIKNYIFLQNGEFLHQDIMASADVALIKPGYGMISEAMVNETPFICPPREDFVEYFAFLAEFEHSGGAVIINRDDYESGNWRSAIHLALDTPYKKKYLPTGALECKGEVARILNR
ncbi:MAG: hypothetical protein ACE5FU_03750 [Nitrospinota bacterium]